MVLNVKKGFGPTQRIWGCKWRLVSKETDLTAAEEMLRVPSQPVEAQARGD